MFGKFVTGLLAGIVVSSFLSAEVAKVNTAAVEKSAGKHTMIMYQTDADIDAKDQRDRVCRC